MNISPSQIKGEIVLPPSKSQTLRAILFASLAKGISTIENPLNSPDIDAMIQACQNFGAKIERQTWGLKIHGVDRRLKIKSDRIHAANSGIVLRFLTAIHALQEKKVTITKDESLQKRPMDALQAALPSRLTPGNYEVNGRDSQPVSALLIALSCLDGKSRLKVTNPGETPWVQMTLNWLGDRVCHKNFTEYTIQGRGFECFETTIPGDISQAAFPAVAALITGGELLIKNAPLNDSQGDLAFFHHLKKMGALILLQDKTIHVSGSKTLTGITCDINACIDSICILSVVGTYANGVTEIVNAEVAREKECDRIFVMSHELSKMGGICLEKEDGMLLFPTKLTGATLQSHHDHRVAMSLTVAALSASSPSQLLDPLCVNKTYPEFFQEMKRLGAKIS